MPDNEELTPEQAQLVLEESERVARRTIDAISHMIEVHLAPARQAFESASEGEQRQAAAAMFNAEVLLALEELRLRMRAANDAAIARLEQAGINVDEAAQRIKLDDASDSVPSLPITGPILPGGLA